MSILLWALAVAAPTTPSSSVFIDELPPQFRGRWGEDRQECDGGAGIRSGIIIGPKSWESSESEGRIDTVAVVQPGKEYVFRMTVAELEGDLSTRTMKIRQTRTGIETELLDPGDAYGLTTKWIKCL